MCNNAFPPDQPTTTKECPAMAQDKERERWQQQGDAEIDKVTVTIEKVKVDVPANVRPKLDEVLQSLKSLKAHFANAPTQLPADPNAPQVSNPMAPGGQPQPK